MLGAHSVDPAVTLSRWSSLSLGSFMMSLMKAGRSRSGVEESRTPEEAHTVVSLIQLSMFSMVDVVQVGSQPGLLVCRAEL